MNRNKTTKQLKVMLEFNYLLECYLIDFVKVSFSK